MAEDIVKRLIEESEITSSIRTAGTVRDAVREIEKLRDRQKTGDECMQDACDRISRLRKEREEARRELKTTEEILDANNSVITDLTNQITDLKMKLRQLLRLSQTMGEIAAEK